MVICCTYSLHNVQSVRPSCLFRRLEDETHMPNTNRTPQYYWYPMPCMKAPIHTTHPSSSSYWKNNNKNKLNMY